MKFTIVAAALAALAPAGAAASEEYRCNHGSYRCAHDLNSWHSCHNGNWRFSGRCPPGAVCRYTNWHETPRCVPRHHGYNAADATKANDKAAHVPE